MWILENEGEALSRESICLFFLLTVVTTNLFHLTLQVNEYGFAPENAIFSVAPSPNVRRGPHPSLFQLERVVVWSADCLLAGQLAIHGPGAEKVSRKHVTITVEKVEDGDAVRLDMLAHANCAIAAADCNLPGSYGKPLHGHHRRSWLKRRHQSERSKISQRDMRFIAGFEYSPDGLISTSVPVRQPSYSPSFEMRLATDETFHYGSLASAGFPLF